jgi:hypothetical protein
MNRFMERMVELQEQQQHNPLQNWESSENTFIGVQSEIQEALVELRETIVNNDANPNVEHSSTSSRTMRRNSDSRAVPDFTERRRTSRVSSPRPLRHRRSPIRPQVIRPMEERARTPVRSEIVVYHDTNGDLSGEDTGESGSHEASQQSIESSSSDPGEGPSTLINEKHPESSVSASEHVVGDFISVKRTRSHIRYNPNMPLETISGYIATSKGNGTVQVTALLDRNLPENIISLKLVRELGLPVYNSEDDKNPKWIHAGNAPGKKSRGYVALSWSQGAFLGPRPFTVHCWVFNDNRIRVLVFGEPFVHKRRSYSEATEAGEG